MVLAVNLVAVNKKMELELKERYEQMMELSELVPHKVVYKYFDYHHECGKNSEKARALIDLDLFPNHIKQMGLFEMVNTVRENRSYGTEDVELQVIKK